MSIKRILAELVSEFDHDRRSPEVLLEKCPSTFEIYKDNIINDLLNELEEIENAEEKN